MPLLTPEAASARPGPDWLRRRRVDLAEELLGQALPGPDEEIWRYSRIAELDLDRYAPFAGGPRPAVPAEAQAYIDALPPRAATVVIVDGELASAEVRPDLWAQGLQVGVVGDDESDGELLGAVLERPTDIFARWAVAFSGRPVLVDVPAGMTVDEPVVVVRWLTRGGADFARLVVRAGADSDVRVLEHAGSADVEALVCPLVELDAGPAARLRFLGVNDLGPRVWQVASQVARGAEDSTTLVSNVSLGGHYARVRSDARLVGKGATGDQLAVFFGERDQMHDFRTLQDHAAPRTTSNLLFKGAVQDHSRSVYSGLIHVRKEAPGTVAFQTNRNIKLSEGAWAESVPNLDIETNDVKCSHASAVGPIDEEQRFYLESRGVPPHVAERLIVLGFFDEVMGRLPVAGVAAGVRAEVAARLERRQP